MGGLLAIWGMSQIWQPTPAEAWLIECPTNLDILVESQGIRLARGDDYLACPVWPSEVPEVAQRWEKTEHRCCQVCRGTWENLCDLARAEAPEFAEACWAACADRHINGKADEATVDWPHLCCAECGAVRRARCTVAIDRDQKEVDDCFSGCAEDRPAEPDTCWWELGFEPGVALRGRYEILLTETGFTARCNIRRSSGEVLEFLQLGKRGKAP
jgi:hypothetical protein